MHPGWLWATGALLAGLLYLLSFVRPWLWPWEFEGQARTGVSTALQGVVVLIVALGAHMLRKTSWGLGVRLAVVLLVWLLANSGTYFR